MSRLRTLAVFLLWLAAAPTFGQSTDTTAGMVRKDPSLEADRVTFKPGQPLSVRALVTTPPPLKGVLSWSLESTRHRGLFSVADVSPDGKLIATGGLDGTIRLWDLQTGKLERALIGHDSYVYGLAFSPEGRYLASGGSHDATARIWEVATGRPIKILRGHPSWVSQVAWTPDGKWLVGIGGHSGDISMWEVASGQKRGKSALGRYVTCIAVHGNRVAAISKDSLIALLDVATGKTQGNLGDAKHAYTWLDWSPDGKQLAAGTDKLTLVYTVDGGEVAAKLDGAASRVTWAGDGKKLAVASPTDATLRVWRPADGMIINKIPGRPTWFQFLPGDDRLAIGDTVGIGTLNLADGKTLARHEVAGTMAPLWNAGRPTLTGLGTSALTLWDPSGKALRTLAGHKAAIAAFAWSPDGKSLATAGHDKTVRIWTTITGELVHTLTDHTAAVLCLAWSPDGKELASGGRDKIVHVWNAKTGALAQSLAAHRAEVTELAWTPKGATLAVGVNDGTVFPYPRAGWKQPAPLAAKQLTTLTALAWSPDGLSLAAGDANGMALVWTVPGGKLIGDLTRSGSPPAINGLLFYPRGDILAAARANHTLELWSMKKGERLLSLPTMAPPQQLTWSAVGPLLAVSSLDRTCRFFDANSGKLRGVLLAEADQLIAVSADGHYRADGSAVGHLVVVAQSEKGQDTSPPAAFATRHSWKNNPTLARFTGK